MRSHYYFALISDDTTDVIQSLGSGSTGTGSGAHIWELARNAGIEAWDQPPFTGGLHCGRVDDDGTIVNVATEEERYRSAAAVEAPGRGMRFFFRLGDHRGEQHQGGRRYDHGADVVRTVCLPGGSIRGCPVRAVAAGRWRWRGSRRRAGGGRWLVLGPFRGGDMGAIATTPIVSGAMLSTLT